MPVAYEVATALGAPLDVIVVRKLGVPFQPELGMGAIGERGVRVLNQSIVDAARVTAAELAAVEAQEAQEVARRARRYRGDRPAADLDGRTVVIVDDGLATGGTARAAIRIARAQGAARIVLAVPVGVARGRARRSKRTPTTSSRCCSRRHLGGVGRVVRGLHADLRRRGRHAARGRAGRRTSPQPTPRSPTTRS